jgi:hypothetical protein
MCHPTIVNTLGARSIKKRKASTPKKDLPGRKIIFCLDIQRENYI